MNCKTMNGGVGMAAAGKQRLIFHCDCNNFFASCECLDHPELKNVPLAVAGDPENRVGVVVAKNDLAKKHGVKTTDTVWQARRKCPDLVFVPPRHHLYKEISDKINNIYHEYTDFVEPASIDESYLDMTGAPAFYGLTDWQLADALREAGTSLLIHNEAADIAAKADGKTLCEHMLDLCQGRVGLQVDAGWAMQGGVAPLAFLRRNRDLVRSVHFKDFDSEGHAVTVGEGVLPLEDCFAFARAYGLPQLIDQDSFTGDLFGDLRDVRQRFSELSGSRSDTVSYLNVMDYETGEIRTLAKFDHVIEAPNWMRITGELVYNSNGLLYAWKDGTERLVGTGFCTNCNNDHVLSPEEDAIAVSHMTFDEGFTSRVYIVPFDGSGPRLVTPNSPS